MNVLPITREGGLLAKLRSMFGADAQIQEGDVRVEKALASNDVAQRFNLNGDGQTRRPLEVFIGLNDLANTIEILNTEQLRRFKIIPQTQASATTLPETSEKMFVPILQPAIFSGRDTNIMEFQPASGSDLQLIGGATGTQNVLVFHYKVLVVRNGAQPTTWSEVSQILEKYTQNRVIL